MTTTTYNDNRPCGPDCTLPFHQPGEGHLAEHHRNLTARWQAEFDARLARNRAEMMRRAEALKVVGESAEDRDRGLPARSITRRG